MDFWKLWIDLGCMRVGIRMIGGSVLMGVHARLYVGWFQEFWLSLGALTGTPKCVA